jgi:hypothetical protein
MAQVVEHLPSKCEAMSSNATLVCFNYLVSSLGTHMGTNTCLLGEGVFYSYNRLQFLNLYITCNMSLCSFERPCAHRKYCHHDEATTCLTPSCHSLGIGNPRVMPSFHSLGKLQLIC